MTKLKQTALTIAAFFIVSPVLANEVAVPEGCMAIATVYKTSCHATTMFDCGASKEAHTFRSDVPLVVHVYTPDWEMTGFRFAEIEGASMESIPDTGANTNLAQLLTTGKSEEAGQFLMNTGVVKDRKYFLSGQIELKDETVEFGEEKYQQALMHRIFEPKPGAGGMDFEIDVYYSPEKDLLIEGTWSRSIFGSPKETFDQTPYRVLWPGEEGFLATRSEQGCE